MKHIGALTTQQKMHAALLAVLTIVIAIAIMITFPRFLENTNAKSINKAVDAIATSQADVLNAAIDKFQSALTDQIKTLGVVDALQQANDEALQALANQIQVADAGMGVIHARLIPANRDYSAMNLRFSQLDRLTSAEHGTAIYPEAFEENGKRQFDFLLPVKDAAGKLVGFLLVVTDDHIFKQDLEQIKPEIGVTMLQQKFAMGVAQTVFQSADKTVSSFASDAEETHIPHWKIIVAPGVELIEQHSIAGFWQYVVDAIAVISCGLVLLIINRRAATVLKKIEAEHVTPIQIKGARKIDKEAFAAENAARTDVGGELVDPLFQSNDVFDLDLDDDMLEVRAVTPKSAPARTAKANQAAESYTVPVNIFRDYDIRGNADNDISDELAQRIGRAFGSACVEKGQTQVVLAGDGRLSTPRLKDAVLQGLQMSGCSVIDIGMVPTPLMNFAINTLADVSSGIMVTASHNPAADNGFKMVIDGHTLAGDDIQHIRERVQNGNFCEGEGECREQDVIDDYIEHIISDIVLAGSYKVVVDCGSGVASVVAPRLLEELGCDVVPLYCEVDGSFPYHQADPSNIANLADLIAAVKNENADMGVAFDGDGDRLAVVTASGEVILPDSLLMLFAKDVVSRNPGTDIIFDVKSTRRLNALISGCGGRPVMCKSGHSHIRNKMVETGAMLGGELSGHIFFKERWFGFDDGVYSAARLLEILSIRDESLDDIFSAFPVSASTPEIRIAVPEEKKFTIVKQLTDKGEWGNGKLSTLDGVRVDFAKGWGLVRASNTAAELTLRFEADDAESLVTVQNVFKQQLQAVDSSLLLPF